MKVVIASDIHGSYKYTKRMVEFIEEKNPDKIVLLGDILYHGARNALPDEYNTIEVTNALNEYSDKIIAVRGNCDSEVDEMVTKFGLTNDYAEITLDGIKFYLTHGHLINKYEYLFEDNYLISGHNHVYNIDGKHLNPGSVGIPKVNKEHTILYYENKKFYLIDLDNFNTILERELNEE